MKLATTTGDFSAYASCQQEAVRYIHQAGFKYIDYNFGTDYARKTGAFSDNWQEEMKKISTVYIAEGETLEKLIDNNSDGNIDFIDGHVIGRVDKTAYVAYKNNFDQTFTVTIPTKHALGDDIQMMHHIPSDTLIHVSKKSLKIQNIIFLSIAGILGIITLVLFIWFKGQTG